MPRASTLIARPALRRLPTRPSRLVQGLIRRVLPRLFRLQGLELRSGNAAQGLAEAFAAQQAGESTLLIAFRHPSTRDPLVLADLFWNRIPAEAAALLQPLPRPVELRFLYDRGIPIWAGPVIGWLLQRCGGIAIHRGRLDRPALAQARATLVQGRHALVVAPEGATNNLSGEMAPLEPGVAQLAFWAADDLAGPPPSLCYARRTFASTAKATTTTTLASNNHSNSGAKAAQVPSHSEAQQQQMR